MRNINALFFHGPSSLMMFTSLILIATWSNHVSGAITTCIFFTRWWFLWLFPSTLTKADSCLGVRPQDRCSSSLSSEEPNPPVGIVGIMGTVGIVGIVGIMAITFITNKSISVIIINQLATNQLVDTSSKFPLPKNIILVFSSPPCD